MSKKFENIRYFIKTETVRLRKIFESVLTWLELRLVRNIVPKYRATWKYRKSNLRKQI